MERNDRIDIRVREDDKRTIRQAARRSGLSLSEFMVKASLDYGTPPEQVVCPDSDPDSTHPKYEGLSCIVCELSI